MRCDPRHVQTERSNSMLQDADGDELRPSRSSRVRFSGSGEPLEIALQDRWSRSRALAVGTSDSDLAVQMQLRGNSSRRRSHQDARRVSAGGGGRDLRKTGSTMGRVGGALAHYAALVIAEDPIKEHKQYKAAIREQEQEDEAAEEAAHISGSLLASDAAHSDAEGGFASHRNLEAIEEGDTPESASATESDSWALNQEEKRARHLYRKSGGLGEREDVEEQLIKAEHRSIALSRWRMACSSIISSARLVRSADTLADITASPLDRFAAAVELEVRLNGHPHKVALLQAMARKQQSHFDSFVDNLLNELLITGETVFDWFTPAKMGSHRLIFTPACIFVMFAVYFFMTGEYQFYAAQAYAAGDAGVQACLSASNAGGRAYGPRQMTRWMWSNSATWCYATDAWLLDADFLVQWGARWGPLMRSDSSRWFSAWFLHVGFQHVLSNMLLFAAVAYQVEEKYGCIRVGILWMISALGGSFFSAAFENTCTAVVGASGGVFGVMGLFIADMIMNFHTIHRPILRGVMMLSFLIYFIITVATGPAGTSHLSHVGGFICGLFPAFLFLPNLGHEKWEAVLPWCSIPIVLCIFIGLPTYFYKYRIPSDCPTTA